MKQGVMNQISDMLGMQRYTVSRGSTVPKDFFLEIAHKIKLKDTEDMTKPQVAKAITNSLGVPWKDNYESQGGTVSNDGLNAIRFGLNRFKLIHSKVEIPKLEKSNRDREFNNYSEEDVAGVIYAWLFSADLGFRDIDRIILGISDNSRLGFESMNIAHFLGLKNAFKGLFFGITIDQGVEILKQDTEDFSEVIHYLESNKALDLAESLVIEGNPANLHDPTSGQLESNAEEVLAGPNVISYIQGIEELPLGLPLDGETSFTKSNSPEGWLYVIINPSWSNWVKIGVTRDLTGRRSTYNTGSPTPETQYKIVHCHFHEDARGVEARLHDALRGDSRRGLGEWYDMSVDDAKEIIQKYVNQ